MSKFNKTSARPQGTSPITSQSTPSGRTFEGAPAFSRDGLSELFLTAVTSMGGEKTFYESASARDSRFTKLIRHAVHTDLDWLARFLRWLRNDANMRTVSLMGALEAAREMAVTKTPGGRQIVASVLQRADEPGEALAYWTSNYGKIIPKPVKRGIADAAVRLYTEYSLLKYDTASKGFRFGDVIELTHPDPLASWQSDLFRMAIERRQGREIVIPGSLPMLRAENAIRRMHPRAAADFLLLNPESVQQAGLTWEDVLSLGGQAGLPKRDLWEAVIPSMGYMAILRNLRNFDEAGISEGTILKVARKLSDPAQVARSRQLPFRFYSAYRELSSLHWGPALEKALDLSLANIPQMDGSTLILIDTSGSMTSTGYSAHSKMTPAVAAALFGVALAVRNPDGAKSVFGFANYAFEHPIAKGGSVLRIMDSFLRRTGEVGHGTEIDHAIKSTLKPYHRRIVLLSDMQTSGYMRQSFPVPLYAFNLNTYPQSPFGGTGRAGVYEMGGLTDATFGMIPLLEAGKNAAWPF